MSVSTVKPRRPGTRLQRLATLGGLATAVAWVFWVAVVVTAVQLLLALTRSGALLTPVPASQPGSLVCLSTVPALLQHAGSGLNHPGLAPGVHATWGTASLCTSHPTVGQALAFAVTLLPVDLLALGALYLVMRLGPHTAPGGGSPPTR